MRKTKKIMVIILLVAMLNIAGVPVALSLEIQPVEVVNPITISTPPAPTAPDNITVSGITDSSAIISWSPVVSSSYSVWINETRWTGADSPGIEIKGLQPYMTYSVYVTASNDGGESGPSDSETFTTLPPVPTAPVSPAMSIVTGNSAIIQWEPLPPWQSIKVYRVYVDGVAIADITPQTGLQVANLTNLADGFHSVFISGVNDNREGPASTPVHFTTKVLPAITNLNMTNHSYDSIHLSWDAVKDASQYLIIANEQTSLTTQTNYKLLSLKPDQEYQITVTSIMPDDNQTQTATLQTRTLPFPTVNKDKIMNSMFAYVPDIMPGLISVFVVGLAFSLARIAKIAVGNKGFFRYWR